jgi:dihydrolipoamide dehydrogenase
MMARKDQVVQDLTDNVRRLLEGQKIEIIHGTARLAGTDRVAVKLNTDGSRQELESKAIILATGGQSTSVPGLAFDDEHIVSSTQALRFDAVPKHLGIVGGGYIGLELGSVWLRLGAKVTVIEMLPKIAPTLDGQVGRKLQRVLKRQGITFHMQTKVTAAKRTAKSIRVTMEPADKRGKKGTLSCDKFLISAGRQPMTKNLGLEETGVDTDPETGQIVVDASYQTSVPGIYAIGDLIPGPMLAHKASAEGIAAVECIAGKPGEVNYDALPAVIYTWPEVASVGSTEEQIKAQDIPYCVGTYPFTGAGRARCMGETEGFVKVIAHAKTDRILGIHIIGPRAADMIAECGLAVEMGASSEDIARTVHGHPTFAEALQEAAMGVQKCSIYAA